MSVIQSVKIFFEGALGRVATLSKKFTRWYRLNVYLSKVVAWLLVLFLVGVLVARTILTFFILEDPTPDTVWEKLVSEEHIRDFIFSPIWVIIGFLFTVGTNRENNDHRRRVSQLEGHLKRKTTVDVVDVLEIMRDEFSADDELERVQEERDRLAKNVRDVQDDELRT